MLYIRALLQVSWYVLTPIFVLCIPQALYVKRTALRLPEAKGEKRLAHGEQYSPLTFLHFGESTVAGVGVNQLNKGLSAQLCSEIHHQLLHSDNVRVECKVTGQNGIRFHELNELIKQNTDSADFAIVTMGVNDTTALTSVKAWRQEILQCIRQMNHLGIPHVFFTQVPPMEQFPALPIPLKYLLGLRAHILNIELRRLCQQAASCHYVGSKLLVEKEMMAEDGYHPSELGYQAWAKQITPQILEYLRR
jgi:lysophospholipase L1-like esterase